MMTTLEAHAWDRARNLVDAERRRQNVKWGVQDHDHLMWLAILGEEFGETAQAILQAYEKANDSPATRQAIIRAELVQVAAVALAWLENMDRREVQQ